MSFFIQNLLVYILNSFYVSFYLQNILKHAFHRCFMLFIGKIFFFFGIKI